MHRDGDVALVLMPQTDRPARFEAWPDDVRERCKELWSSARQSQFWSASNGSMPGKWPRA